LVSFPCGNDKVGIFQHVLYSKEIVDRTSDAGAPVNVGNLFCRDRPIYEQLHHVP
jgi:hypothetical protein